MQPISRLFKPSAQFFTIPSLSRCLGLAILRILYFKDSLFVYLASVLLQAKVHQQPPKYFVEQLTC